METAKHTPGPWRTSESSHRQEWSHWIMAGATDKQVAAANEQKNPHEADANARLIASAPDFHDAGDCYIRWMTEYACTLDEALVRSMEAAFGAKLRIATAKAEGRSL